MSTETVDARVETLQAELDDAEDHITELTDQNDALEDKVSGMADEIERLEGRELVLEQALDEIEWAVRHERSLWFQTNDSEERAHIDARTDLLEGLQRKMLRLTEELK